MRSDDLMRSDDVVTFFEKCLREQGLESVEVTHNTTSEGLYDEFYIRKEIGGEQLVYKTGYDFRTTEPTKMEAKKLIALEAEQIANEFENKLTTTFKVGRRRIDVCPFEGGWAKCIACGTKATAPKAQIAFTDDCELSDPIPTKRNISDQWRDMSDNEQVLFKMYLVGLLRDECDYNCPNSKYNADAVNPSAIETERFK